MKIFLALVFTALVGVPTCRVDDVKSDSKPVTHELWTAELQKYVTDEGWVDYAAWDKDTTQLVKYLDLLETHHPNDANWSEDEQLAYWINAYNAYTVKLILDNWPLESIKDIRPNGTGFINSVWDVKFIEIEGHKYDLNNIEHGIIRPKFEDNRIHVAVNCASVSCPPLINEAFTAERLDEQLDAAVTAFLEGPRNELVEGRQPKISSIFKWYSKDFEWKGGSLEKFVETAQRVCTAFRQNLRVPGLRLGGEFAAGQLVGSIAFTLGRSTFATHVSA